MTFCDHTGHFCEATCPKNGIFLKFTSKVWRGQLTQRSQILHGDTSLHYPNLVCMLWPLVTTVVISVTTKWPKLAVKCWRILGFCCDWSQNFIYTRPICDPSFLLKWFSSVTTVVITMTTQSHKFLNFWQIA